ncbi:hypothetical protein UP09_14190 [Bradyrhizobium sp. LTSP885]|uniref:hypothetical protein n=1 Tax=Bradyrhizobium sp. LTSP885 TaxID=1619232 RepID=UPI0005CB50BC|nr:hypothetical protein [Bradyrhizobium sp. LTSP885]KJC44800.1 hypothetical protein UP09_14190 [Bradyrhizobium sp. LTSP885]
MRTSTALQILSAIAAFGAAWFWLLASVDTAPDMNLDSLEALKPWLDSSARLNKFAAMCAAISALCSGMTHVVDWLEAYLAKHEPTV